MSKLYFYYGTMGSSKTANALMQKFSFEEKGLSVILIKPSIDTRDGQNIVKSRMGLSSQAVVIQQNASIISTIEEYTQKKPRKFVEKDRKKYDIIIADEAQFFSESQIDELRELADSGYIIFCYGLKTDFQSKLFRGSKRLLEVADKIREIPSMCSNKGCGRKSIINARVVNGKVATSGEVISIGGDELYKPLCYKCWKSLQK